MPQFSQPSSPMSTSSNLTLQTSPQQEQQHEMLTRKALPALLHRHTNLSTCSHIVLSHNGKCWGTSARQPSQMRSALCNFNDRISALELLIHFPILLWGLVSHFLYHNETGIWRPGLHVPSSPGPLPSLYSQRAMFSLPPRIDQ